LAGSACRLRSFLRRKLEGASTVALNYDTTHDGFRSRHCGTVTLVGRTSAEKITSLLAMTQETPTARPKVDKRQILLMVATAALLGGAAVVLTLAVDTGDAGKAGLGSAIVALVTGTDSPEAHIDSMPMLWLARVLVIASIVVDVFLFRYILKRGQTARAQEPTS
jgi:hypothetical protein